MQVAPMENAMQKSNEVNCVTWSTLGQFKKCYILICCQISGWWEESYWILGSQNVYSRRETTPHPCKNILADKYYWVFMRRIQNHLWAVVVMGGRGKGILIKTVQPVSLIRHPFNWFLLHPCFVYSHPFHFVIMPNICATVWNYSSCCIVFLTVI